MAKTRGPSAKAYYARYKSQSIFEKNKRKKLERALKQQPDNQQIVTALKNISYKRHTPNTSMWSHTKKNLAKMLKQFTQHMDYNVFNTNKDISVLALSKLKGTKVSVTGKVTGKLGERAHDKSGNLVWA